MGEGEEEWKMERLEIGRRRRRTGGSVDKVQGEEAGEQTEEPGQISVLCLTS